MSVSPFFRRVSVSIQPQFTSRLRRLSIPVIVMGWMFLAPLATMLSQGFVNIAPEQNMVYTNPFGQWGSGLSLADWNRDGWPDVTACRENGPTIVYTQSEGQFLQSELAPVCAGEGKSIQWVDIDDDGDLDLFITQEAAPLILLEQTDEGLWTDRSSESNLPLFMPLASCASWSDYDRDGDLDVYLGAYHVDELNELGLPQDSTLWDVWNSGTSEEWPAVTNKMFRNEGEFLFTDVTEETGLDNGIQLTLATLFHDIDLDGWPDLLVANDKWNPNAYYHNDGNGSFEDLSVASGFDLVLDAMTLTEGDINQDGLRDFLITNTPQGPDVLLTYNPESAQFENIMNAHFGSLLAESWTWGARFIDYDNDTDLDAFVAEHFPAQPYQLNHFFENGGTDNGFTFFIPSTDVFPEDFTNAHSVASADWNRDGRIDFAVHNLGNHKIRMWENVTVNTNHWVEIELQGVVSNSQAIGSWVAVYCDHPASPFRTYTALGEDYLSQSESALHFGLAQVAAIDSVVVTWPTGTSETWNGLDLDQLHTLTEGEAAPLNPCPSLGGSCQGCTYSEACNFDPEALIDDGTCFFDCFINSASCGPGTVWDTNAQTCIELELDDCPTDINSDGVINISDLLWFLVDYGLACPE